MALAELHLTSGQSIELTRLHCRKTYADMLIGAITHRANEFVIQSLIDEATKVMLPWPVALIDPRSPDSTKEPLPPFVFIGALEAFVANDSRVVHSGLNVIWFEDSFTIDFSQRNRQAIARLDWRRTACVLSDDI